MFRKLIALFLLGCVIFGVLYFYIDRKVEQRLRLRRDAKYPAVYSEVFNTGSLANIPESLLREELAARRYTEVSGSPQNSGEYRFQGGIFEIYTHEFLAPDANIMPAAIARIDLNNLAGGNNLTLEPIPIAYLGATERRASEYAAISSDQKLLVAAVISIEDERFAKHFGIDLAGIARAIAKNIAAFGIVEGGSTITQQLAKNLLFSPRRTLGRKILEAMAALSLERRLSKKEILELYLNEVYLGQEGPTAIHGMKEAAKNFFGKELEQISAGEAAMLAGLVKAPSFYSPRKHYERALTRMKIVLNKMYSLGYLSERELKVALVEKPKIIKGQLPDRSLSHFTVALTKELTDNLNLEAAAFEGVSIFTGIIPAMQRCAESAVSSELKTLAQTYPNIKRSDKTVEAGLVAIEPHTGKIRAWVGSENYSNNQFDHVNQALRQVGSTIKPFLYLTALDPNLNNYRQATTITVLSDEPMKVDLVAQKDWVPENYDREFRGNVTLRYALENSLNVPAAYMGQRVGIKNLVKTGLRYRLAPSLPEVPSLALGAADTTLLNLTSAYAALDNGGIYVKPRLYVSVIGADSTRLSDPGIYEEKVSSEAPTYVVTNIMQGVIERGTGQVVRRRGFNREAAGKTGTSNEARDAWFVGFTPNLAAGVWVGYDDNSKIGLTGGVAAAPIWAEFMKCSQNYFRDVAFVPAPGVAFVELDSKTLERATSGCPRENVITEVFVRGSEPKSFCHQHAGNYIPEAVYAEKARSVPAPRRRAFWDNLFDW